MASEGEQYTVPRRRARGMTNTGNYSPDTSVYQKPMSRADTSTSPHTTDGYRFDEGMIDPPRAKSSVVRFNTTTKNPRLTGTQPIPSPVPPRRQGQGMTRDFPSYQTSSPQTPRQPRQPHQPRLTGSTPQTTYTDAKNFRQNRSPNPPTPRKEEVESSRRVHWLLPAGVGMIAMLVLWIIGSNVLAWGTQRYNDIVYGMPRTYQTDAVVGHGGDSPQHPSHFIAINLNHQAVIIELMAGDPAKSVSYKANFYATSSDDNLAPVTLEFKDVNNDGKPDMIVHIHLQGQDQVVVFINDGKEFRPLKPNEKITY